MKLLVTGASGFVGRNFIKTYSEKYHIYAIVREHSDIKDLQDYCEIFRHSNDITKLKDYLSGTLIGGGGFSKR